MCQSFFKPFNGCQHYLSLCSFDNDLANHTNLTPTKIADLLNFVKFFKFRSKYISNTAGRFMNNKTKQLWEALFPLSLLTSTWKNLGTEKATARATYKLKIWKRYVDGVRPRPCKRLFTMSITPFLFLTNQLQETQTVFSLALSTESPLTLTNTRST